MLTNSLNVPHIRQRSYADCLLACTQMVLAFLGRPVTRRTLEQILEPTAIGTPGFNLLRLRSLGYGVVYSSAIDERPLTEALATQIPPIVLLRTRHLHYWDQDTAHAVVVTGMDAHAVYLNDPAFPAAPQAVSREEFMLAWSDFDMLYAVIQPTGP